MSTTVGHPESDSVVADAASARNPASLGRLEGTNVSGDTIAGPASDLEKGQHAKNLSDPASGRGSGPESKKEEAEGQYEDEEEETTDVHAEAAAAFEADFPEGGLRAWSVVLGSVFLTASTFGYANSWIWQEHYSAVILQDESASNIAWIGSVQYALVLMPGILSGRLMDLGHLHIPLAVASAVQVVAVFLSAECTEYWQFILCQGILLGLGAGFAFGPSLAVVSHWFNKRRPLAYGVVATGSSIGGVIFPLVVKKLLPEVGFKWTMRITAFMLVFTFGCANLLVKKRLPPKKVKGGLLNLPIFKNVAYSIYGVACIIGFLGVYTALTYSDVAASEAGINHNLSLSLVAIANGSSFFGRVASGYLAGLFGPFNVLVPWTIVAGAMTWAWPYATEAGAAPVVVVIVIYGMASGAFVGLIGTPLSHSAFGEQGDIGRRIGMIFTLCAIGALCGTPISGAIHSAVGGYKAVGWYAGALTMLCVALLMCARRAATGTWWARF